MKYSWDPAKASSNFRKRGVRFSDLEPVFEDEMAIVIDEIIRGEERSVIIGMDGLARILVVV
ncbi:MAG: BrnT family toxin [Candidatus Aminicenantales bacterium]